jgi:hypothetical protein
MTGRSKMGQRPKAELLDLVERVCSMHDETMMTFADIETQLRSEGIDISREAIRRTVKSNKTIAKELMKTREETTALINTIRDNPATDTNEATLDYLIGKAFQYTKTIESVEFADLPELAKFVKDMTRAKTQIVRMRMDYQAMFAKVKEGVLKDLQRALEGNPEIYNQLFAIVNNLEAPNV